MDSPPPRPTDNRPSPPRPADIPSPQTNAHLAALLADSYRDADALRRDLGAAQKRAEKADRISEILAHAGDSSSPSSGGAGTPLANGDTPPALTKGATAEQLARVIARYEDRLADAERQRDDSETRRRETVDAVRQLDDFLATLEHYAREARGSFKRSRAGDDAGSGAPFVLPPLASILQAFGPPSAAAHQGRHHARSDSAGGRPTSGLSFPLPPHPHPNPVSTPHAGARRPRTPSMDGMYGAPPSKRPRGDEHRSGREARAAYSESYIPAMHLPHDRDRDRDYGEPLRTQALLGRGMPRPASAVGNHVNGTTNNSSAPAPAAGANPRIIAYGSSYGSPAHHSQSHHAQAHATYAHPGSAQNTPAHHHHHSHSHSHSHSGGGRGRTHSRSGSRSSSSSMDIDEMLLKATTHEEGGVVVGHNGAGPHHLAPPAANNGRFVDAGAQMRKRERERERENASPAQGGSNPYPPTATGVTAYGAAAAGGRGAGIGPGGGANAGANGNGTGGAAVQQTYTTHVFAPVVTGAPTKKTKFPNTLSVTPAASIDGVPVPAPTTGGATPQATPYASTNAQGQRICRQCGMVGRYKDGKCVEKWGPGPMGPGTVCDRCRKKMKRVERRGTLDQLAAHAQQHQPIPPTALSRGAASFAHAPHSNSGGTHLQRADTMPALRDESQRTATASTLTASATLIGAGRRAQPPPPAIAALRTTHDEGSGSEDIPTSDIGRGGRRPVSRPGSGSGGSRHGRGSLSDADAEAEEEDEEELAGAAGGGRGGDDGEDGEGDEDGDAEADLLDAVDAAEANSVASSAADRAWKDEDN